MLLCAGSAVFWGETLTRTLTRQILYLWVRTKLAATNFAACDFSTCKSMAVTMGEPVFKNNKMLVWVFLCNCEISEFLPSNTVYNIITAKSPVHGSARLSFLEILLGFGSSTHTWNCGTHSPRFAGPSLIVQSSGRTCACVLLQCCHPLYQALSVVLVHRFLQVFYLHRRVFLLGEYRMNLKY